MKNLKVTQFIKHSYPEIDYCELATCGKADRNSETKILERYIFILQKNTLSLLSINEGVIASCSISHLFPSGVPSVKGVVYLDMCDTLYSFYETGDILLFSYDEDKSSLQAIYFTHAGEKIEVLEWSPDKEVGVYVTEQNELRVITLGSFEVDLLKSHNLDYSSSGKNELVNIGWGKKETQFHGSEGKSAALRKLDESHQESFTFKKSAEITWRGDSTMFAVGYWCINTKKRRVKIFAKNGTFLCINENIPGFDGPMSWKPQGNLIALSQQLPNKYVISFMEKNGLKHLDFELPSGFLVKQIIWNTESKILCLLTKNNESNANCLMLWTCGNYHWYLKQMFSLNFEVVNIFWDEDRINKLYVISKCGSIFDIEFIWIIDHSNYNSSSEKYYVSVIDNEKILLTPFHSCIIPPPMCKWILKCPASINRILFPPIFEEEDPELFMCAILQDGRFCFFYENSHEVVLSREDDSLAQELSSEISMYHWTWVTRSTMICISSFVKNTSTLMEIRIDSDKLVILHKLELYHPVASLVNREFEVFIYLLNGKLIIYDTEQHSLSEIKNGFPEPCYHIVANSGDVYGLSEWNRLYKNDYLISFNITSFLLHPPYVVTTTLNHVLCILNCDLEEISLRKIERGSKLVAVTGNTVIMQLPRGNLETIQPRALTIMSVGKLLDKNMFNEAIQLLRRQRICFDLCVDHNPKEFFANINHFVKSVDPQWITLFVTELISDDVTKGIYSQYYKDRTQNYQDGEKISKVCNTLLEALFAANELERNMLPSLSCLVKTKNIAKAIEMAITEQALQHLMFLVDVDTLYWEALGAYNLDAALKIAGKSQMDPKEYIPYLNSLREMDINYMKYEIDKMLKRSDSALRNLSRCCDQKEELIFTLIEESQLYSLALELFSDHPRRFSKAAYLYGEYLFKNANFEESGVMFVRSNNLEKAILAFTRAGNWRQCMVLAKRCNYSAEQMKKLADSLCGTLILSQNYGDAATIYKEYFSDINKAIDIYLQGHIWDEAIYLAEISETGDLIDTKIKKNVLEAADVLLDELTNVQTKLLGYIARLKKIRLDKLDKPKCEDIDESMSDTSSVTTRSNQTSLSKSSRMTKKMSRKMWSLKEGNPREEEALVATLSQMFVNSLRLFDEVKQISITLLHFKADEKGESIQNAARALLKNIEEGKGVIWIRDPAEDEIAILDSKYKYPPELHIDPGWELITLKNTKHS